MSKKGSFSLFRQGHRDWLRTVLGKQERVTALHLILCHPYGRGTLLSRIYKRNTGAQRG